MEIRSRTHNRHGLQDAVRAITDAGCGSEVEWPPAKVLKIGDDAIGVPALSELYEKMKAAPVDAICRSCGGGSAMRSGKVVFDDKAPLATLRKAITAPQNEAKKALSE